MTTLAWFLLAAVATAALVVCALEWVEHRRHVARMDALYDDAVDEALAQFDPQATPVFDATARAIADAAARYASDRGRS